MINNIVTFFEGFDPLFNAYNSYEFALLSLVFFGVYVITNNIFALIIVLESLISTSLGFVFNYSLVLETTAQFLIFAFCLYVVRKNPLISVGYIILILLFLVKYITNTIHESVYNMTSYNWSMIAYYAYYLVLPFVLFFMILGLFNNSDGGKKNGVHSANNSVIHSDHTMLNVYNSRYKRLFKKSLSRVKKIYYGVSKA